MNNNIEKEVLHRQITTDCVTLSNLCRSGIQSDARKNVENAITNRIIDNVKKYETISGNKFEMTIDIQKIINA